MSDLKWYDALILAMDGSFIKHTNRDWMGMPVVRWCGSNDYNTSRRCMEFEAVQKLCFGSWNRWFHGWASMIRKLSPSVSATLHGSGHAGVAVNERVDIPTGQCEELSQLTLFAAGCQITRITNWCGGQLPHGRASVSRSLVIHPPATGRTSDEVSDDVSTTSMWLESSSPNNVCWQDGCIWRRSILPGQ